MPKRATKEAHAGPDGPKRAEALRPVTIHAHIAKPEPHWDVFASDDVYSWKAVLRGLPAPYERGWVRVDRLLMDGALGERHVICFIGLQNVLSAKHTLSAIRRRQTGWAMAAFLRAHA